MRVQLRSWGWEKDHQPFVCVQSQVKSWEIEAGGMVLRKGLTKEHKDN